MPRSSHVSQATSAAFFVGLRVSGDGGRDRENAHADRARLLRGAIGFACSSGLVWLAVQRTICIAGMPLARDGGSVSIARVATDF